MCEIDIVRRADIIFVRFPPSTRLFYGAELDRLSGRLFRLVRRGGRTRLVLSLGNVEALGASALGTLVRLRWRVGRAGGKLCLCGLRPVVREVFEATRLDTRFVIRSDEGDALNAV
jgi:anti-sigma B factor antagonist